LKKPRESICLGKQSIGIIGDFGIAEDIRRGRVWHLTACEVKPNVLMREAGDKDASRGYQTSTTSRRLDRSILVTQVPVAAAESSDTNVDACSVKRLYVRYLS